MPQLYITKLDPLNTNNHSGVEPFNVQNIKNQTDVSFKKTYNKWFTGPQLVSLLD
jgi:hypothetical protein